jgi:hypothetical protein
MPKPAPEHALLKNYVGTWNAEFKMGPTADKGTVTWRMLGDFWAVGDLGGHLMGAPFAGHQVLGWDASSKEYLTTWCDSSSAEMSVSRGHYDAASKTLTAISSEPDMLAGAPGKRVKVTHKTVWHADGSITCTYTQDGSNEPAFTVTCTKAK